MEKPDNQEEKNNNIQRRNSEQVHPETVNKQDDAIHSEKLRYESADKIYE